MKSVIFISQKAAERYIPISSEVLISIATPGYPQPTFLDGWHDILRLSFHDVTDDESENNYVRFSEYVLFSEEDAKKVVAFAKKHENYERIVIHCWAGVSRSSALAEAIANAQGRQCPTYDYNKLSNARARSMTEQAFKSSQP